jgi:hypothetical protein
VTPAPSNTGACCGDTFKASSNAAAASRIRPELSASQPAFDRSEAERGWPGDAASERSSRMGSAQKPIA